MANDLFRSWVPDGRSVIDLELEKAYRPLLLFAKKRYSGLMFTDPSKPATKLDCKGIQIARRDSCAFVRRVMQTSLDKIMFERDVEGAVAFVKGEVKMLLSNKVVFDELLLSKQLRDNYKNENLPHLKVAQKMRERDPASAPRSGDRVPFVYVEPKDPKLRLACDFAEDPVYAKMKSLLPHSVYYLDNQLHNPIVSLFDLIVPDIEKRVFGDPAVKVLRNQCVNRAKRQKTIASFFNRS